MPGPKNLECLSLQDRKYCLAASCPTGQCRILPACRCTPSLLSRETVPPRVGASKRSQPTTPSSMTTAQRVRLQLARLLAKSGFRHHCLPRSCLRHRSTAPTDRPTDRSTKSNGSMGSGFSGPLGRGEVVQMGCEFSQPFRFDGRHVPHAEHATAVLLDSVEDEPRGAAEKQHGSWVDAQLDRVVCRSGVTHSGVTHLPFKIGVHSLRWRKKSLILVSNRACPLCQYGLQGTVVLGVRVVSCRSGLIQKSTSISTGASTSHRQYPGNWIEEP